MNEFLSALIGALIGVLGGIYATRRQVEASRWQLDAAKLHLLAGEITALETVFIQYPECRGYFYDGVPCPPTNSDHARALAIAQRMLFHFALLLTGQVRDPKVSGPWIYVTIRNRFRTSPLLCRALLGYHSEYSESFREQVTLMCEALAAKRADAGDPDGQIGALLAEASAVLTSAGPRLPR